ncbi:MAG: hypothetical protein A2Y38_15550 [Spirochaetes bacterium GWB1_59_5]|nr:MAG: hypothetical protein A2Y38_15550 [Spirochaetes bacterium GWB1_59_5]
MATLQPPKKDAERRAWIKYQLELRGYNFASIARELGVDRSAPKSVFSKHYPKMERAIAERLGLTAEELWPERYPTGEQITRKRRSRQ